MGVATSSFQAVRGRRKDQSIQRRRLSLQTVARDPDFRNWQTPVFSQDYHIVRHVPVSPMSEIKLIQESAASREWLGAAGFETRARRAILCFLCFFLSLVHFPRLIFCFILLSWLRAVMSTWCAHGRDGGRTRYKVCFTIPPSVMLQLCPKMQL